SECVVAFSATFPPRYGEILVPGSPWSAGCLGVPGTNLPLVRNSPWLWLCPQDDGGTLPKSTRCNRSACRALVSRLPPEPESPPPSLLPGSGRGRGCSNTQRRAASAGLPAWRARPPRPALGARDRALWPASGPGGLPHPASARQPYGSPPRPCPPGQYVG